MSYTPQTSSNKNGQEPVPQVVNGTFRHIILPQADIQRIEAWPSVSHITPEEFNNRRMSRQHLHQQIVSQVTNLLNISLCRSNMQEHDTFCSRISSILQRIHVGQWDTHFSQLNSQCAASMINGETMPENESRSRWIFSQVDDVFQPAPVNDITAAANFGAFSMFAQQKIPIPAVRKPIQQSGATTLPSHSVAKRQRDSLTLDEESDLQVPLAKLQKTSGASFSGVNMTNSHPPAFTALPRPSRPPTPSVTPSPPKVHQQVVVIDDDEDVSGKAATEEEEAVNGVLAGIDSLVQDQAGFWAQSENANLPQEEALASLDTVQTQEESFEDFLRSMLEEHLEPGTESGGDTGEGAHGIKN